MFSVNIFVFCFFFKLKTVDCLFHFSAFLLRPGEGLIGKTRNRGGQREQAKRSDMRALINMVTKITDLRAGAGPPTE